MKQPIYADNAATTKLDKEAFKVMKSFLLDEYGNASQPYSFSRATKRALAEARATIANCIGAQADEIFFTSGGTESDNWAVKGLMACGDNREILTSQIEHHALLNACVAVERFGVPVSYLPVDKEGVVTPEVLTKYITNKTKLVSVMLANNEIGTIEPIAELAAIAHKFGALIHTDAVQAVGHIPINVKSLNVDMLSASGHKFNAPKGVGFLYIKKGTKITPYVDGGVQESGMRAGTENIAAIVAMAKALEINCATLPETEEKLRRMTDTFLQSLDSVGVEYVLNGGMNRLPGNISISIKGVSGEMLLHRLDLQGIYISTGSACDSVNTQISHVIEAINVPKEYAEGTIRISFGKDNAEEDALKIAEALVHILKK